MIWIHRHLSRINAITLKNWSGVKPGLHIYEAFQNICQVETIHTVILTWKEIEKFMNWQFT